MLGLPNKTGRAKPWRTVTGPLDVEDDIDRVSLDLPKEQYDFLGRFATYRNALADVQEKRLKRRWTRKSMGESMLIDAIGSVQRQLAEMIAACGELPDHKDMAAMKRYVQKVLAWDAKRSSKK